jgi:hypothetical protein
MRAEKWKSLKDAAVGYIHVFNSEIYGLSQEAKHSHLPHLLHPFLRFHSDLLAVISAMPSSLNLY